jgi:hypothetical protein
MIQTTRPEEVAPSLSTALPAGASSRSPFRNWILLWSSFLFALLQSLCTFFLAISGVRLLLGVSTLIFASSLHFAARFHVDRIRIPMVLLALVGTLINLYAIRRVRRLRSRPSAQWRLQPVSPQRLRSERIQISLAVITLVLLAVEEIGHIFLHHVL